ncbi:MAG: carboxypeptidase-like regulatory domain-containing protein [Rickettsiales bacterium]|jgi:flagellar motor protein MotB|nr:carboxypeptidase-like regulatory domain-containing protein [Rickettsiales bacterium]
MKKVCLIFFMCFVAVLPRGSFAASQEEAAAELKKEINEIVDEATKELSAAGAAKVQTYANEAAAVAKPGNAESTATITISGMVSDNAGPLVGASISSESTLSKGVQSDAEGKFEFKNFPANSRVKISYIGMKTVILDNDKISNIVLEEDTTLLDEDVASGCIPNKECNIPELDEEGNCVQDEKKQCKVLEKGICSKDNDAYKCVKKQSKPAEPEIDPEEQKRIEEKKKIDAEAMKKLVANENAMKEKENSTANKLLGGAAIGSAGMGGKMLLSGMAEQSADKAIQEEMQGVLNSMYCKVPGSTKINYGTTDNPLPGDGVQMAEMRGEYERIATQLKSDKESLGMMPGIEAETVFDKRSSGLYDKDTAGYKVREGEGNIASVFGALSGNEKDKALWDAQLAESKTQVNAGIGLAATGVVGGIVGNMLINKDAPKENSKQILQERKDKLAALNKKIREVIPDPVVIAPANVCTGIFKTGEDGECECINGGDTGENCKCSEGQALQGDRCATCPAGQQPNDDRIGCKETPKDICAGKDASLFEGNEKGECVCKNNKEERPIGTCVCPKNSEPVGDACKPCDDGATSDGLGVCVLPPAAQDCPITGQQKIKDKCQCTEDTILNTEKNACIACGKGENANADQTECVKPAVVFKDAQGKSLFNPGNWTLSDLGKRQVEEYKTKIASIQQNPICYVVVGHSDKRGINPSKNECLKNNEALSKCRADVVSKELNFNKNNSLVYGVGPIACEKDGNAEECRKVIIVAYPYACTDTANIFGPGGESVGVDILKNLGGGDLASTASGSLGGGGAGGGGIAGVVGQVVGK